jgi:O-antigen/teichoic acid export membrane protein
MSTAKRVIKNTGFLYAKMGITMFISLYTTRLILNSLGTSDFGIFNIVGGAIAMLGFLNAAMAGATQRFMSYSEGEGDKEKQKKIFNISVILHFGISIVVGVALLIAGWFFFHGILNIAPDRIFAAKVVYGSLIVSTIFTVMTVPYDAVLNAHENMLYYSIVGIVESVLKLAVALAVVHYSSGDKLILYGILMACIPFIIMSIMRIYCHRKYIECVIAPKTYWDKPLMKEMTGFAGWSLLGSSSGVCYGYGTNIVLNNFFGTILNAANGVCGQLNGQLLAFSNNMLKAVNPIIVKAEGNGNRAYMFRATFGACKLSVLIYSLFAIPFLVESSFLLKFWLKNAPPFADIFLQLMIIQVLIEQISLPLSTSISAIGKIKQFNIVNSALLYFSIIVLFFLYKVGLPPETLRILAIVVALLQTVYKVAFCSKYCQMPLLSYLTDVFLRCALVIAFTLLLVILTQQSMAQGLNRLLIVVGLSISTFIVLFYLIALRKEEKKIIQNMIKQRLNSNKF